MSDMAKQARAAMKAKASRLTAADPHQKVDSSTWTPPDALNTEAKTGLRPISRRAFKKGGKVIGKKPKMNLGKSTRGGNKPITPDNFANKDVKAANEDRAGIKHIGALKRGGKAMRKGKAGGGYSEMADYEDERAVPNPNRKPEDEPLTAEQKRYMERLFADDARASREDEARKQARRDFGITGQKHGGKVKKALGGSMAGAKRMLEQGQETSGVPAATMGFSGLKKGLISPARGIGLKKGGTAKHDDVKEDMALIKKMVKPSARKGREGGGVAVKKIPAGVSGLSPEDAKTWAERTKIPKFSPGDYKDDRSGWLKKENETTAPLTGDLSFKKGGKAKRKGRAEGGDTLAMQKLRNIARDTDPRDNLGMRSDLNLSDRMKHDSMVFDPDGGEMPGAWVKPKIKMLKKGGRTARKDGGGIFTGTSYPGKVPGVVPGGRTAHAAGGKAGKGKGKTNINIVIAAGKQPGQDMMGPPPGMDAMTKGMPVPVGMPPGAGGMPMGGGAPPMPMPPMPAPGGAPMGGPLGMPPMPRKSGGRLTAKASSYKDMTAGSAGGEGRLQKTDIAEKHKGAPAFKAGGGVYRSYKDMDAGSASGLGRLEKTEIQKRKS